MLTPRDEADLAEAVAGAAGPLRLRGGGTRPVGKPVAGEVLSVAALSGIALHDPGALTLVARAGTPLDEIEAALRKANQRLAFEPMDHRPLMGTTGTPTIGGVVAANVSGPRRVQVGAARDFVLGLRFVDGSGTVVRNGGRVMKNVTGYDLVKLLSGSHGTLGVLTEVALKVLPAVESSATLTLRGLDDARAVAAMAAGLGSPYEVSGAAHDPQAGETRLRIEGFAQSVAYRAERLAAALARFGAAEVETDGARNAATWAAIRDVTAFAGRAGDVWRMSVKPSDAPGLVARLGGDGAPPPVRYDRGGGLVWVLMPEGADLRARLGRFAGHATLMRAAPETRAALPVFQPEAAPVAALSAGLRARFDPRGILNPGLMG